MDGAAVGAGGEVISNGTLRFLKAALMTAEPKHHQEINRIAKRMIIMMDAAK